ncbi:AMP-binding protein [Cupriavidus basilensis]|uniref:AMP-binding protein n=1 Tax=Cupriavidus basilensis TaxID=68895 RepID=A0ABT6AL52_9BURK|nr:AMP-binding protein [Cupriavidus basilensis]MDF3833329.1 AMP-binding protein [Cupriavidus basilensis]
MAIGEPQTLPDCLRQQARQRPHAPALRHKRLGRWQVLTWQQVVEQTEQLAAGLTQLGFAPGDTLALVSHPRTEALLLSLAAQWAGGVAVPLDPHLGDAALDDIVRHLAPRFAFAEDDRQLDRLLTRVPRVIDANPRGLPGHPHAWVTDYGALHAPSPAGFSPAAQPHGEAFTFLRAEAPGELAEQRFTHAALVREARHVAATERLHAGDEAFAARAFAAAAQARYLIAPWLLAGFRLNFPESLATRDNDRRELAPTLVAGTRETYARLAQLVDDRLPGPHTWRRKLLASSQSRRSGPLTRAIAWWLVARPLREVIGFSRTHAALVTGPALNDSTAALFAALRVDVHAWPETGAWQRVASRADALPLRNHPQAAQPAY